MVTACCRFICVLGNFLVLAEDLVCVHIFPAVSLMKGPSNYHCLEKDFPQSITEPSPSTPSPTPGPSACMITQHTHCCYLCPCSALKRNTGRKLPTSIPFLCVVTVGRSVSLSGQVHAASSAVNLVDRIDCIAVSI